MNLTRPKTGSVSKNPSTVPGHVRDLPCAKITTGSLADWRVMMVNECEKVKGVVVARYVVLSVACQVYICTLKSIC
jgi:hypothetical protein